MVKRMKIKLKPWKKTNKLNYNQKIHKIYNTINSLHNKQKLHKIHNTTNSLCSNQTIHKIHNITNSLHNNQITYNIHNTTNSLCNNQMIHKIHNITKQNKRTTSWIFEKPPNDNVIFYSTFLSFLESNSEWIICFWLYCALLVPYFQSSGKVPCTTLKIRNWILKVVHHHCWFNRLARFQIFSDEQKIGIIRSRYSALYYTEIDIRCDVMIKERYESVNHMPKILTCFF